MNTREFDEKKFNFDELNTLVIEGCGVRFVPYIQALKVLEENHKLAQVTRVAASSSGAIISLLWAVGYTPSEMEKMFDQIDFADLLDPFPVSKIPVVGNALSIALYHGTNSGAKVLKFIEEKIKQKGLSEKITFKQLYEMLGHRELYLTGTALTRGGKLQIFSHETTPDVPIAEALTAAVAYPGVVSPYPILVEDEYEEYFDGGIRDNFPIDLFPMNEWSRVLCLRVDTYAQIFGFPHQSPTTGELLYSLVQDEYAIYLRHHKERTIQMYDCNLSSTQISLTPLQKLALKLSGRLATEDFVRAHAAPKGVSSVVESMAIVQPQAALHDSGLRARTEHGVTHIRRGQAHFSEIIAEIKSWDDGVHGCYAHYHLLIAALREQSSRLGNRAEYDDLLNLLKERGAKTSFRPETSPAQVTDIAIEYLKDRQVAQAYQYLRGLYQNSKTTSKVLCIDHHAILRHLPKPGMFSAAVAIKQYDEFVDFVDMLRRVHLADCPGASAASYVIKLNDLLQSAQYSKALELLKECEFESDTIRKQITEAMQKQLEEHLVPEAVVLLTYLQGQTGRQEPVRMHVSLGREKLHYASSQGLFAGLRVVSSPGVTREAISTPGLR